MSARAIAACAPALADGRRSGVRRSAQRCQRAGRVRHPGRAARALAGSDLSLGTRHPDRSDATPLPTTTSRSPTSTRGSWTKLAPRMRRLSKSSRPMRLSSRTSICSRKSMTARRKTVSSLVWSCWWAHCAGCTSYFEIPIETPDLAQAGYHCVPARARRRASSRAAATKSTATWRRCGCCAASCGTKGNLRVIDAEALPLARDRRAADHARCKGNAAPAASRPRRSADAQDPARRNCR